MGNFWLKVWVWTKVTLVGLLLLYLLAFIFENSQKMVTPWFWFGVEPSTNVLFLSLYAFLAGVLTTILLRTTFATLRQLRELRERQRADRLEREVSDMKAKAAMVRTKGSTETVVPSDDAAKVE
jgi:hypothetical protein